jgi:hypothetical protein
VISADGAIEPSGTKQTGLVPTAQSKKEGHYAYSIEANRVEKEPWNFL